MTPLARPVAIAIPALAAVAFWRPLNEPFSLPKATILVVGALLLIVLAAVEFVRRPVLVVRDGRVVALLLALAAAVVLSTLLADHRVQALVGHRQRYAGGATCLAALVLCLVVSQRFDERAIRALALALVAAAGLVAGYALVQLRGFDLLEVPATAGAAVSTMGNIDFVSGWLAIVLPLTVWAAMASTHRDVVGLVAGGIALAVVVALLAIDSFQGPVAGAAGLAVLFGAWAADRGLHRRVRRAHIATLAIVVAAALGVLAPHVRVQLDEGLAERRFFWSAAVRDIGDRPVAGHGLDSFGDRWFRLRAGEHAQRYPNANAGAAHDIPLDMGIGGGLPLLGLYLAVVAVTGRRLLRGLRTSRGERRLLLGGIGGAWFAYQVQSLVSINVPALVAAQWALTGAVLALTAGPPRERALPRAVPILAGALAVAALVPAMRPLQAELRLADAGAAERAGRATVALAAYRDAAALGWWETVYQSYLAVRLPDPESLAAAVRAAELSPGDPYVATRVAEMASAVGDHSLAREWREASVRDDPRNSRWRRR